MLTIDQRNTLLGMSANEISFLANISLDTTVTSRLLDSAPLPYMLYGNPDGWNGKSVFKYTYPSITNTGTGAFINGKLTGVSPTDNIPMMVRGKNGEITEKTTDWAIQQVNAGKMTIPECTAIIRTRNYAASTTATYSIPIPLPTDSNGNIENRNIFPLAWNETYEFKLGNADVQKELAAIDRAHSAAKEIEKTGADIETGVATGRYHVEELPSGGQLFFELVPNPFYDEQITDADFDGIPNSVDRDTSNIIIPTHVKKPVVPDISPFFSENIYSEEEISLTAYYLDKIVAGTNASGAETGNGGKGILSKEMSDILASKSKDDYEEEHKKTAIGEAAYGAKNYVYAGFFVSFFTIVFLDGLRDRALRDGTRTVASILLKRLDGREKVAKFLEGPLELGLTNFKYTKDVLTQDGVRLFRDWGVYRFGHWLSHEIGEAAILDIPVSIGTRTFIFRLPWVGWGLAAMAILWDLFGPYLADTILENEDEREKKKIFKDACTIQKDPVGNETVRDPGLAYYTGGVIQIPRVITRPPLKGAGAAVGAEKNPESGTYIIKPGTNTIIPITISPVLPPPPPTRGGVPGLTVPRTVRPDEIGFLNVNEQQIQEAIESSYLEINLANSKFAEELSNLEYNAVRSDVIEQQVVFPREGDGKPLEDRDDFGIYFDSAGVFADDFVFSEEIRLANPLMPNSTDFKDRLGFPRIQFLSIPDVIPYAYPTDIQGGHVTMPPENVSSAVIPIG